VAARHYAARATRYAIPLAVFYRTPGDLMWSEGRTENISKSGVLVRGDRAMPPNADVEILLNIPANVTTPFSGTTLCRGRIVRAVESSALENRPAFAAAILEFETTHLIDPRRI